MDLANAIERRYPGHIIGINIPRAGSEIDIETANAIIEYNANTGQGLTRQIANRISGPLNPTGKPVIGYAPNMSRFVGEGIDEAGGLAGGGRFSTLEDLLGAIAPG